MCHRVKVTHQTVTPFCGSYAKANNPTPFQVWVYLAPCDCGKKVWGRLKDGGAWIEIEEAIND